MCPSNRVLPFTHDKPAIQCPIFTHQSMGFSKFRDVIQGQTIDDRGGSGEAAGGFAQTKTTTRYPLRDHGAFLETEVI